MAKKHEENPMDISLDTTVEEEVKVFVPSTATTEEVMEEQKPKSDKPSVNCLRNERIIVRHIPKQKGNITNPKHVLYGGMSNNAVRVFSVPKLSSGSFVNVLTNAEKSFLEEAMGLEYNALSIHRKVDNFWDDSNTNGISQVRLQKQDNYFDLSDPVDYIKYKVLLANKNSICPSLKMLADNPKATYQFVIINEGDETKAAKQSMTNIQRCYREFGKIEEDKDTLRFIIETITGVPTAANTKLDWLQTKVNDLIQSDSKMFLNIIQDELITTKVLIKKCVDEGLIAYKGNQLYLRENNTPLCEFGEEPTLSVAAQYLNKPKHQDVLFALQAKLK